MTDKYTELNSKLGGIEWKSYTVRKNIAKGSNEIVKFSDIGIGYGEIACVSGRINAYNLPNPMMNLTDGTYNAGYGFGLSLSGSGISLTSSYAYSNALVVLVIGIVK